MDAGCDVYEYLACHPLFWIATPRHTPTRDQEPVKPRALQLASHSDLDLTVPVCLRN